MVIVIELIRSFNKGKDNTQMEKELRLAIEKYGAFEVGEVLKEELNKISSDQKNSIREALRGNFASRVALLQGAENKYIQKDYEGSINDLQYLIDSFNLTHDWDKKINYFSPRTPFDLMLRSSKIFEKDRATILNEPLGEYYHYSGFVKFTMENYEDAIVDLEEAIKLNPYRSDSRRILAEIHLRLKNYVRTDELLKEALKRAYVKKDIGTIYISMGKYHFLNNNKEAAIACLLLSEHYYPDIKINNLYDAAMKLPGDKPNIKKPSDLQDIFKKHQIQFGPSKEVIEIINVVSKISLENKMHQAAKDVLQIGYDLTGSEFYLKQIEALNNNAK